MAEETRNVPDEEKGKEVGGAEWASPAQSSSKVGSKAGEGNGEAEDVVKEEEPKPKDSVIKKAIEKIGLDVGTVMMMFKYANLGIGKRERIICLLIEKIGGVLRRFLGL